MNSKVRVVNGNIFTSNADVLVCPVNTVGVMGAGLAVKFAKRYSGLAGYHKHACNDGILRVGNPVLWRGQVLLFPTKEHWRNPSDMEYIKSGLRWMVDNWLAGQTIAFPRLGCGLGGLSWSDVRPVMLYYLGRMSTDRAEIWVK